MTQPTLETLPNILFDPELLLGQLRQFVGRCRSLLEDGTEVELTGLDDQVRLLCEHIRGMEHEDAQQLRPKMQSLVEELDLLSTALLKQKAAVSAELAELSRQRNANAAYQRVESSVPRDEDEDL
jgi:hypothetical protein